MQSFIQLKLRNVEVFYLANNFLNYLIFFIILKFMQLRLNPITQIHFQLLTD